MTPEQIRIAIQNTTKPVINKSGQARVAIDNTKKNPDTLSEVVTGVDASFLIRQPNYDTKQT